MKKILFISFAALLVLACSRKTVTTTTSTPALPKEEQPVVSLAAQGHTVYTGKCGKCHELKKTEAYTAVQWDDIMKRMAPKAKLNEAET